MHKKSGSHEPTHLLMDGGTLVVEADQVSDFMNAMAASVLQGQVNFLCEKRSAERLRLCVDVDIYTLQPYGSDRLLDVIRIAAGVAYDLFSNAMRCLDVLVSAADPFETEKNGVTCVKTGVHLVWEHLPVDVRTAGIFRDALVQRLELSTLDAPIGGWAVAIDSAIAKHGILRMLYAHKLADCAKCHNKKADRESCVACLGKGRIDIGRPYRMCGVFIKAENRLELMPPARTQLAIVEQLMRATIHTLDAPISINMILPTWFEDPLLPFAAKGRVSKRSRRELATTMMEGQDTLDALLDKEAASDTIARKIEAYVRGVARRELISVEYKDVGITQAMYAHDKSVIYAKTDSCYCLNTRNEHKSNTIYFELKRCGEMRQKCFCRCDTTIGRRHGLCSAFKSHPVNIPDRLLDALFQVAAPPSVVAPTTAAPSVATAAGGNGDAAPSGSGGGASSIGGGSGSNSQGTTTHDDAFAGVRCGGLGRALVRRRRVLPNS